MFTQFDLRERIHGPYSDTRIAFKYIYIFFCILIIYYYYYFVLKISLTNTMFFTQKKNKYKKEDKTKLRHILTCNTPTHTEHRTHFSTFSSVYLKNSYKCTKRQKNLILIWFAFGPFHIVGFPLVFWLNDHWIPRKYHKIAPRLQRLLSWSLQLNQIAYRVQRSLCH